MGNDLTIKFAALRSALIEDSKAPKGQDGTLDVTKDVTIDDTLENKILKIILDNPQKNLTQISKDLNISYRTTIRTIKRLQEENKIVRVGGRKLGYWKDISNMPNRQNGTLDVTKDVTIDDTLENKILKIILDNPQKNLTQISKDLNISYRTTIRTIKRLQEENKIVRVGGKRFGHWEVK